MEVFPDAVPPATPIKNVVLAPANSLILGQRSVRGILRIRLQANLVKVLTLTQG